MMLRGYWWFAVDGGVCGDACDFIFWFGTVGFGCGLWLLFGVVRVCMLGVWLLPLAEACDLRVCGGILVCG